MHSNRKNIKSQRILIRIKLIDQELGLKGGMVAGNEVLVTRMQKSIVGIIEGEEAEDSEGLGL